MAGDPQNRLRRITIPIPNPALGKWLKGPQARTAVENAASEIYIAYVNNLPVITGNLRRGAYYRVGLGGWGADQDRWFGWVGNRALSYRPRRGVPYAAFIEYGKPTRGLRSNSPGRGEGALRRAAHIYAGGGGSVNLPAGLRRGEGGRKRTSHLSQTRDARGRFGPKKT